MKIVLVALIIMACSFGDDKSRTRKHSASDKIIPKVVAENVKNQELDSTVIKQMKIDSIINSINEPLKQIDKKYLNGTWARISDKRSVYKIKGDSIYYTSNPLKGYFLELEGSQLIFNLDNWQVKSEILKLTKDSLIMIDEFDQKVELFKKRSF